MNEKRHKAHQSDHRVWCVLFCCVALCDLFERIRHDLIENQHLSSIESRLTKFESDPTKLLVGCLGIAVVLTVVLAVVGCTVCIYLAMRTLTSSSIDEVVHPIENIYLLSSYGTGSRTQIAKFVSSGTTGTRTRTRSCWLGYYEVAACNLFF